MNKKILMISSGVIVAAATVFGAASSVSAYQGNPSVKGPNYTPERHEAVEKAFASNDYSAWVKLMDGRGRATEVINQSNFAQFAEAHRLSEQGKFDEANALRKELGLRTSGQGTGSGYGYGRGQGMRGNGMHRSSL